MTPWILACAAGLALSLVGEVRGHRPVRAVGKLAASGAFLGLAWNVGLAEVAPHGPWMVGGLLLSALGDALLLADDKRVFLAGLVAFLLAHVAYAVAYALLGPALPWVAAGAVGMLALGVGVDRWLGTAAGRLRPAVLAYTVAIGVMVSLAAGVPGRPLLTLGAVLFAISDLFVARQRFVAAEVRNRLVGLPLYYLAQILLVVAAAEAATP
ncbi:MAG: lysoplasmalogenase [Alphaproteobacteria bacterium]|nr:lysoplasmalogenase [Alphaproteobacteria bacterium]